MATPAVTVTPPPAGARWRVLWGRHGLALSPALCLLGLLLGALGGWLNWPASVILMSYLGSYVAGGLLATQIGLATLRAGRLDVNLLMVAAAIGAAVIGQWQEGAVLLFLFSLSNALQEYALERSRAAITRLMDLRPDTATVLEEGVERRRPIEAVRVEQTILVRPGERLPLDGEVLTGATSINQAPITGESLPVVKATGDPVFAGTINQDGAITVRVTKLAGESTLARIITLVEEAQANQAPTQRWIDTFEQRYALAVIAITALAIALPPLFGEPFPTSFYRAMTLLVVASPCALVISTPAAVLSAIANAARNGILFKGGAYLEAMADLRVIAFDKTGTLTSGQPQVTDLVPYDGVAPATLLQQAAAIEQHSEHPLARALVTAARGQGLALPEPTAVTAVPGRGVRGTLNDQTVLVGNSDLFDELGQPLPATLLTRMRALQAEGKTAVAVTAGRPLGVIAVADTIRPTAAPVIQRLRRAGITSIVMLTGDSQLVAEAVGRQIGVDDVRAELLPQEKQRVIAQLVGQGQSVAMVGDGVNDAPALATANLGVAMGAAGSDVALETADVVLMADDLSKLAYAIDLSRQARRIVIQNLTFALLVIVVLIVATLFGTITLPFGVLGHEGSTVLVVLNSLRLLARRAPSAAATH